MDWYQEKLNEKYNVALEGVKKRFFGIFSVLRVVLEAIIEIDGIVGMKKLPESSTIKPLLDNIMHIVSMMITEYPPIIDLEYCESFLTSIQERLELLYANFHPLNHFTLSDSKANNRYIKLLKKISDALVKAPKLVLELQVRAELSVPLLTHIDESLNLFKVPVQIVLDDIKNLKLMEKTKTEFEHMQQQLDFLPLTHEADRYVVQMAELVKNLCDCQLELETILDPVIRMCHLIKNKGKKLLGEESRDEHQELLKYVKLMVKPDFISNYLPHIVNIDDFISAVKDLES